MCKQNVSFFSCGDKTNTNNSTVKRLAFHCVEVCAHAQARHTLARHTVCARNVDLSNRLLISTETDW